MGRAAYQLTYQQLYYASHKEARSAEKKEKVVCECGCEVSQHALARHRRRQIHHISLKNKKNKSNIYMKEIEEKEGLGVLEKIE